MINPIRDEDARSLAEKLSRFAGSLNDGERQAFESLERNIGMLIDTDDIEDEASGESHGDRREALWYELITRTT